MRVPAIWPDGEDGRDPLDAVLGVAAGLEPQARLEAPQPAIPCRAEPDVEDRAGCRVRHPEVLVAGELEAHRPTEQERGCRNERFDQERLATEPATERGAGHPYGGPPETEQTRQLGAGVERPLRGRGDVQRAVLVELGHRHLRLEIALVDPARREPTLDDDVARRERGRDVAPPEPGALDDVVGDRLVRGELLGPTADRGVLQFGRGPAVHIGSVEARPRCARRDGAVEIGDRFEGRRLDRHEQRGIGGGLGCLRDHQRDRLTGPQDLVPGQRLVEPLRAVGHDREVRRDEHGHHAGRRQRRLAIDPLDPGVGGHREDRARVEQAAAPDVGREARPAGHLRATVDARDRAADRAGQWIHAVGVATVMRPPSIRAGRRPMARTSSLWPF